MASSLKVDPKKYFFCLATFIVLEMLLTECLPGKWFYFHNF